MKTAIKYFFDFYFYSSLHISLAAVLLTLETYFLFSVPIDLFYLAFVFFSTLLVYSLHRIIGLNKLKEKTNQGRFLVIRKYESHIRIYAVLSLMALIYILSQIDWQIILYLIPAGIISILYTFPVFFKGKRLRDYNYIKIFIIALVWTYVCGIIPVIISEDLSVALMVSGIEKAIFFLAITIPFDIRDYEIDHANGVKTLAHVFGINRSWNLSFLLLLDGLIMGIILFNFIPEIHPIIFVLIYTLSFFAFKLAKNKSSDYYYSGLLDGLIIVRAVIIMLCLIFL